MNVSTGNFRDNVRKALGDASLQAALQRTTSRFTDHRDNAFAKLADPEGLRLAAAAIRDEALAGLPEHLERLEERVRARGGHVHWAANGREACAAVAEIARAGSVRVVVKSKSMTSEEIGLTPYLATRGMEVFETDLGEYIIQIDEDRPSHIIAPAIHKSKAQVADLFRRKLGHAGDDEIPTLVGVARRSLRKQFLAADMGITGANFAVAETGSIVLVENEGNAGLTTTLPRIHVAVMGIEKVIPRLSDLAVLLALLPRSATGQKLGSYISILTGPRAPGGDGPEEFHLVLLDNGRTRIYADPAMRDCLRCVRCGACLNSCPVYNSIGGHAYGWVYPGPIGSVLTQQYLGLDSAPDLPFACSLCGACASVCPVRVPLPGFLLELRSRTVRAPSPAGKAFQRWFERTCFRAWAFVTSRPRLNSLAQKLSGFGLRWLAKGGGAVHELPPPFDGWTRTRDLPAPPKRRFRDWWARRARILKEKQP